VCANVASAQVGLPDRQAGSPALREPFYFTPKAGRSQLPDSQQAATGFGMRRKFQSIEKKKIDSLRVPWPRIARLRSCATLRQQHWERRRRGVNADPSMFRLCPAGSVKRCCGLPGEGGPSACRNHDPPNLTAQCKQTRNICQGEISDKAQNLGASCLMCLSLVVMFQADTTGNARGASGNLHRAVIQTIPHNRCALFSGAVQNQSDSRRIPRIFRRSGKMYANPISTGASVVLIPFQQQELRTRF
jgi:hypothetical protein